MDLADNEVGSRERCVDLEYPQIGKDMPWEHHGSREIQIVVRQTGQNQSLVVRKEAEQLDPLTFHRQRPFASAVALGLVEERSAS